MNKSIIIAVIIIVVIIIVAILIIWKQREPASIASAKVDEILLPPIDKVTKIRVVKKPQPGQVALGIAEILALDENGFNLAWWNGKSSQSHQFVPSDWEFSDGTIHKAEDIIDNNLNTMAVMFPLNSGQEHWFDVDFPNGYTGTVKRIDINSPLKVDAPLVGAKVQVFDSKGKIAREWTIEKDMWWHSYTI